MPRKIVFGLSLALGLAVSVPAKSQDIDLSPEVIEQSPTLQRWLREIPDISHDIRHILSILLQEMQAVSMWEQKIYLSEKPV
jgi:hypothetical protein